MSSSTTACWMMAALVVAGCGYGAEQQQLASLRAAVGSRPIAEGTAGLGDEKAALEKLTTEISRKADRKSSARLDWMAGECQRLRQLFDEPGAWEEAERRLQLAIARDPNMAEAHVSLGQLYLVGGFELAPRAEAEFVRALEGAGDTPLPEAHRGLFLAYYYQGRWADALRASDRYLAAVKTDEDHRKMRAMAEANLARKAGSRT